MSKKNLPTGLFAIAWAAYVAGDQRLLDTTLSTLLAEYGVSVQFVGGAK